MKFAKIGSGGYALIEILRKCCKGLEFCVRLIMVNIPSYVLAKSPEIDRICSCVLAYLLFQIVGLCWAFLVNASFAIACRSAILLPPLQIFGASNVTNDTINENALSSVQLISTIYVSYASIRIVVNFAQHIFHFALESVKDFPDAAQVLSTGGVFTLRLCQIIFVPALALEIGLLTADYLCFEGTSATMNLVCHQSGLIYLTSSFTQLRRLVFYSLLIMVIQIWQSFLHQFPRWDMVFKQMPKLSRAIFQVSVILLAIISTLALGSLSFVSENSLVTHRFSEEFICFGLFGWTLWLCCFSYYIVQIHGPTWTARVTVTSLEHLAAYLRISQICLYGLMFVGVCFQFGFLQAQLDLTFITIIIPVLYCSVYLLVAVVIRAGPFLLQWGVLLSFLASLVVTRVLCNTSGKGSVILVFMHIFGKLVQFFGDEHHAVSTLQSDLRAEYGHFYQQQPLNSPQASIVAPAISSLDSIQKQPEHQQGASVAISTALHHADSSAAHCEVNLISDYLSRDGDEYLVGMSPSTSQHTMSTITTSAAAGGPANMNPSRPSNNQLYGSGENLQLRGNHLVKTSSEAMLVLEGRGDEQSSLVSLGLSPTVNNHWLVTTSKSNLGFVINIIRRWLLVSDSVLHGIFRIFAAFGVVLALTLCVISLASYAQQSLQLYPKLIDYQKEPGFIKFDHRVVNLTLHTSVDPEVQCHNQSQPPKVELVQPHYASCDWKWNSLSLLDFALLSELAYFDDDGNDNLADIVGDLLPGYDFNITASRTRDRGVGPMYLELTSVSHGITILAVRGTDIGRLHDFLEDVKLYAEPVLFSLLSSVFPTIRLWSHETTSNVIQWLYEFNSFFGLQGESDYYKPLVQRVFEIAEARARHQSTTSPPESQTSPTASVHDNNDDDASDNNILKRLRSDHQLIITGHSLGGGLARIVGALTGQASVSFSPPGLGLSYRKYSAFKSDGSQVRVKDKGISQIDNQVGLVQRILCDKEDMAHQNSCHLLEGTICHILEHCGDDKGRYTGCTYDYDWRAVVPSLVTLFMSKRWLMMSIFFSTVGMFAFAVIPDLL